MRGPILKLLSATGFASVAGYLGMLVLVRLYPAESFGLFDFLISVVGILTPVVSLRYEDALMLAEDDRDGAHAYLLSIGTAIALSSALWLLVPFRVQIGHFFDNADVATWLWIIPVLLIIVRLARISELWLTRQERFGRVSAGQIAQTSSMIGVRIGAGFLSASAAGLVYGFAAGWTTGLLVNARLVASTLRSALSRGIDLDRIRFLARRYRRFPLFTMPAAMISMMGSRLPFLLLVYFFTLDTVGYFGRAYSALFMPLSLVGIAVAQVFFVRAVEARRSGTIGAITDIIHRRLVFVALFPCVLLALAGPELFGFLFGDDWRLSGAIARHIAPWIFFTAIASPMSRLFDVLERQKLELATNVAIFIVIGVGLWYGGVKEDLMLSLLLLGIGGGIVRFWQLAVIAGLCGISWRSFFGPYLRYGLISIPWLLPVAAALTWATDFVVFLAAAAGGIGFAASVVFGEGLFDVSPQPSQENPGTIEKDSP